MDYRELFRLDNIEKIKVYELFDFLNIDEVVKNLLIDMSVKLYYKFKGGRKEVYKYLEYFFN